MNAATQAANELIRLSDELLQRYGVDVDAYDRMVRCVVMSEFLITTYSVPPDLTVYGILQLDNEGNISQLFAARRRRGSGTTDLQLYRDGPWEETFGKIGTEMLSRDD